MRCISFVFAEGWMRSAVFAQLAMRAKADRDVNVTTPNLQLFLLGRQQASGPSNQTRRRRRADAVVPHFQEARK